MLRITNSSLRIFCRAFTLAVLIVRLTSPTQAQDVSLRPKPIKIERGHEVLLVFPTPIDSKFAQLGEDVPMKLFVPLVIEGAVIFPAGFIVHARVTRVRRAGKNCRSGQITWKLAPVIAPDGRELLLEPAPVT